MGFSAGLRYIYCKLEGEIRRGMGYPRGVSKG
jgi:hypothetical protein